MASLHHWADQTVDRIIKQRGDKDLYVCASGISPSGHVHIGNFREIITTELIVRAFKSRGKNVRFIYSWDDYDRLRKIPKGIDSSFEKYMGISYSDIPDPLGNEDSYALYFEKELEGSLSVVGVNAEYIRQSIRYKSNIYKDGIKEAFQKRDQIREILDRYRKEPLDKSWYPATIYCSKCKTDNTVIVDYDNEYNVEYTCECGHSGKSDFSKDGNVKLVWRVDWPMRWRYEGVDFEPGGKDHSSQGGSYDTSKIISKEVFGFEAPIYVMYDFIRVKGKGGKISSSAGDVIRLADVLEIYEPQMIRWLFASYKTNVEFAISYDLDVLKLYEDYDRLERKYWGLEELSPKKADQLKRVYVLSQVNEVPEVAPFRASLRHLCNVLQINDFNIDETIAYYKTEFKNDQDEKYLKLRISLAEKWIKDYAPEEFKFEISKEPLDINIPEVFLIPIREIKDYLSLLNEIEVLSLSEKFYEIIKKYDLDNKEFFKYFYLLLINKEKGPKLAGFIVSLGKDRVVKLLSKV